MGNFFKHAQRRLLSVLDMPVGEGLGACGVLGLYAVKHGFDFIQALR
jgi:hypothetical protein